ncbi:MAG: hypothetical protein ACTSWY_12385 [Promethearchaeota archaeon]
MGSEKEEIINTMVAIREELNESIDKKKEIIELLKEENIVLKNRVKSIDKFISINSILSAEQMMDAESFLKGKKNKQISRVDFTKKIFSPKNPKILLVIFRYNGESIEVFFPNPQITQITPISETYLNSIIQPLMNLKESEKNMNIAIEKQNDQKEITKLIIRNIFSFENIEIIFKIFSNLIDKIV